MPDLKDGESIEMKGSGSKPYVLKNVGGVYSCTCPAWRNQSLAIEQRTCKHLRALRGEEAEQARVGSAVPRKPAGASADKVGPPLLLAERWEDSINPTGWWLSEKLDGLRAYWDGKTFISRLGNRFHAPDWFIAGLPALPLDGELWIGRKQFQRTSGIVRRQDKSDHWKEVTYVVFDVPGMDAEFEKRLEFLEDHLRRYKPPHAIAHPHELCKGIDHLRAELVRVESLGGEGLMIRKPGSKYEAGRSATLLKVKSFLDAEARVLEHLAGAGRHKGRLGALLVEMGDGTQFSVGTGFSDAERESPPPVGSIIAFRYQELSDGGVPRFPSYVGVREEAIITPPTPTPSEAALATPAKAASKVPAPKAAAAKPAATATPAPAPAPGGGGKRYFEFSDAKSSKFWEVSVAGADVTTRWGRLGSDGQSKTKTFKDDAGARAEAAKLIAEKTEKGYMEK